MSDGDSRDIGETMSLLGKFYENLDLLAPGDDTLTKEAFHRVLPLQDKPRILDIGCGTGRSTLVLAEVCPGAKILAIDTYQSFLDKLDASAKERGLEVETRCLSMDALEGEVEEESVDLIWAEGSAYIMGFENALKSWRGFLKDNGAIVVSELCWLTDDPPDEVQEFWAKEYPEMAGIEEAVDRAGKAGFRVFDKIALPEGAWEAYYGPLEDRCDALGVGADMAMASYIRATRQEIDIFRRYPSVYGYVMFLMRQK